MRLSDHYKRENVGLVSFFKKKNPQRLHSVSSSRLSPGSHTNQRSEDEPEPIYTKARQATPSEPLHQSHSDRGGAFGSSIILTKRCFVIKLITRGL